MNWSTKLDFWKGKKRKLVLSEKEWYDNHDELLEEYNCGFFGNLTETSSDERDASNESHATGSDYSLLESQNQPPEVFYKQKRYS